MCCWNQRGAINKPDSKMQIKLNVLISVVRSRLLHTSPDWIQRLDHDRLTYFIDSNALRPEETVPVI